MNVRLKGDKELAALFNNLDAAVRRDALRPLADEAAEGIAEGMRKRVPVDTGTLRDSITWQASATTGAPKALVGVGKDGWYWHLVEYGTKSHTMKRVRKGWRFGQSNRKGTLFEGHFTKRVHASAGASSSIGGYHPGSRAKPFLRPAMRRWQRILKPKMAAAVERVIGREWKKAA